MSVKLDTWHCPSVSHFSKLIVNKEKSTVDRPQRLKFLGYAFYYNKDGVRMRVHEKPIKKFKEKLKFLTGRSRIGNIQATYLKLKQDKLLQTCRYEKSHAEVR